MAWQWPENHSTSFKTCFSAKSPGANGLNSKQRAKKAVPNSQRLVDFAIGLFDEQVKILWEFKLLKNCHQSCSSKVFFKLVEIIFGPLHASFSLVEWQDVKLTFFAPFCNLYLYLNVISLDTEYWLVPHLLGLKFCDCSRTSFLVWFLWFFFRFLSMTTMRRISSSKSPTDKLMIIANSAASEFAPVQKEK